MAGQEQGGSVRLHQAVVILVVTVVSLCALAASTRPGEYHVFSGFISMEHARMGERALLPQAHTLPILRGEGLEGWGAGKVGGGGSHTSGLAGNGTETESKDEPLTAGQVDFEAKEWAKTHPEEARKLYLSTFTGAIIGMLGIVFLLTSEINTVLVVRDKDLFASSGAPMPVELEERAEMWDGGLNARWRPWLSLGGVGLMVAGGLLMFYPFCSVLADFGLPQAASTADCATSVALMAVVGAIGWACLLTSLCWVCTRPWASLLLCSISLGAQVSTSVASPFLILFWAVSSGFLAYWYLAYIPEAHEGYRPPDWRTPLWRDYRGGGQGYQGGGQGVHGYGRPGFGSEYQRPAETPETTAYV